jgi:hypothetical protein
MTSRKLFLIAGATIVVVLGALYSYRWLQVDRCLDNGGAWNYELRRCEGTRS